ncbi:phosphatidic acid phosphatase [Arthrobacter sp. NPDC090010]|uniref:phosphatidic acid phosphatase n=1 Tax=Arthrobacter sp. NPDC090010 TaxID=3363942 RepID=UPI0038279C2E
MHRLARIITEVLSPTVLVTAFLLVSCALTDGWRGFWFGLLAAVFTALGPFVGIVIASRRGRLSDHHVGNRRQRLPVLLASLVSAGIGFALLVGLGAPRAAVVGLLSVALGMVVVGAVNAFWKLSVHMAVVSFTTAALIAALSPWGWLLLLVPAAVGWSRVRLGDHTVAQVLAGIPAGLLVWAAYAVAV